MMLLPSTLIEVGDQVTPPTVTPKFVALTAGNVDPIASLYLRINWSPVTGTSIDWSTGATRSIAELFVMVTGPKLTSIRLPRSEMSSVLFCLT